VYKVTPEGTEEVLYRFTGGSDGAVPAGGLIFDASGNLYGTAINGGSGGGGTVFKLTASGTFSVIYSLVGDNGPADSLAMDAQGNLYGTTYYDGAYEYGMVFKLTPEVDGSWTFTDLHDFHVTDGAYPLAGVTFDSQGNLYGTAEAGGGGTGCIGSGCGTIWEITP
jgi:uncharacterized repeat protein (TIGR03803 family)